MARAERTAAGRPNRGDVIHGDDRVGVQRVQHVEDVEIQLQVVDELALARFRRPPAPNSSDRATATPGGANPGKYSGSDPMALATLTGGWWACAGAYATSTFAHSFAVSQPNREDVRQGRGVYRPIWMDKPCVIRQNHAIVQDLV